MVPDGEARILAIFKRALQIEEIKGNASLALQFTELVVSIENLSRLGHELCLAIRYGLFGSDASSNGSIAKLVSSIEEVIEFIETIKA